MVFQQKAFGKSPFHLLLNGPAGQFWQMAWCLFGPEAFKRVWRLVISGLCMCVVRVRVNVNNVFTKNLFSSVANFKNNLILCSKGNESGSWNNTGIFVSFAVLTREILFQHLKRNFVSPSGHVISNLYTTMENKTNNFNAFTYNLLL